MAGLKAEILKQDDSDMNISEVERFMEERDVSDQIPNGDTSDASGRFREKRKAVKVEDEERENLYSASPPPKRVATPVPRSAEPNEGMSGQNKKPNGRPAQLPGNRCVNDDEPIKELSPANPTVKHVRQDRGKFRASITEDDRGMIKPSKRINSGLATDFVHEPLVVEYEPSLTDLPDQVQKILRCQIRLLELEPSQDPNSPIRCTLCHVFVDESPAFKALSYVWGEAFDNIPIYVDDKSYTVTTNCHAALRRLRLEKEKVCLWIDSICINQADLKEKSFQIVLMRDIYSMAEEVFVWLGNSEHHYGPSDKNDEELAITLIKDLVRSPEVFASPQAFIVASTKGDVAEARWRALARTFQHPWFERLWVHQEIIVAKAVKVLGVTYCMRWELLAVAALAIEQNARVWNTLSDGTEDDSPWRQNLKIMIAHSGHLNVLRRCWPQWFYNREKKEILDVSLLQILQNTRHYKCQNPLDKCFAIFGLVSESKLDQNLLHPDYGFSINLLYTYVAWHIIRSSNSLEILCLAGLGNHNRSVFTGLPSWVVDWREDGSNQPYQFDHEIYNAVPDPGSLSISFSKEKLSLTLSGGEIDKVFLTKVEDGGDFWKSYALDKWKQNNFFQHPARCDAEEAWLRTVTADIGVHEGQEQRMTDLNLAQIRTFLNIRDLTCNDIEAVFPKEEQEYGRWSAEIMKAGAEFARIAARATHLRAFFISRAGYMGIGPLSVKRDDMIWLVPGCKVPLVIRKIGDDHYLIGECFAWGLMGGAGVDVLKERNLVGLISGAITTRSHWVEMELR